MAHFPTLIWMKYWPLSSCFTISFRSALMSSSKHTPFLDVSSSIFLDNRSILFWHTLLVCWSSLILAIFWGEVRYRWLVWLCADVCVVAFRLAALARVLRYVVHCSHLSLSQDSGSSGEHFTCWIVGLENGLQSRRAMTFVPIFFY